MKNVVLIGFGKSATTTLNNALSSVGYNSFHHDIRSNPLSKLVYESYYKNNDPYLVFDKYSPFALTQIDTLFPELSLDIFPQLDYDLLSKGFENESVSYILNYRDPDKLVQSFARWKNGDYMSRLIKSDLKGLPAGYGKNKEELILWINNHYSKCRSLFSHSDRFIEVDIESKYFKETVESFLGVNFNSWGMYNKNIQIDSTMSKIKYI